MTDKQMSLTDLIDEFQQYADDQAEIQHDQEDENVSLDRRAINEFLEELRTVGDFLTALIVQGPRE